MAKKWFETWFDSPYYHILYSSRNDDEASTFIDQLSNSLHFQKDWNFCDSPCGKGRHARYLHSKGFQVTGLDLSPASIAYAKTFEAKRLHFEVHDIRDVYRSNFFDVHLNLFTSFGYFDSEEENILALQSMLDSLKTEGLFIIDYMNSKKAVEQFQRNYIKTVAGIDFKISKYIEKGYIIKKINFTDQGENFEFYEKVKLLFLEDFIRYFEKVGLELKYTFGNYHLELYEPDVSPRLIFVCQKN